MKTFLTRGLRILTLAALIACGQTEDSIVCGCAAPYRPLISCQSESGTLQVRLYQEGTADRAQLSVRNWPGENEYLDVTVVSQPSNLESSFYGNEEWTLRHSLTNPTVSSALIRKHATGIEEERPLRCEQDAKGW